MMTQLERLRNRMSMTKMEYIALYPHVSAAGEMISWLKGLALTNSIGVFFGF